MSLIRNVHTKHLMFHKRSDKLSIEVRT